MKTMIDANYIYGVLNGRGMTLGELSSLIRLDTLCLTKALSCLRQENELCEYTEDGNDYIELRLGYQF